MSKSLETISFEDIAGYGIVEDCVKKLHSEARRELGEDVRQLRTRDWSDDSKKAELVELLAGAGIDPVDLERAIGRTTIRIHPTSRSTIPPHASPDARIWPLRIE